jgi:hypothetical protein
MNVTDARDRLIANIQAERALWANLVEAIGEDRMDEPGPMGEWTFKDLSAHLLGWRDRTITRLEAAAEGRPEPPAPWPAELDDDDSINDWIHEHNRHRTVREVLDDIDQSYERLEKAIAALPEETVTDPDAFPWLGGQALADRELFGHLHAEHEPSIRAWLDQGA